MIWELRCARINSFASLVPVDRADSKRGHVRDQGRRPRLGASSQPSRSSSSPRKKKQPPRANVIHMKMGALVLDAKAKLALGSFLSKFGQLLELHLEGGGETLWFYNVTNMVQVRGRGEVGEATRTA